MDCCTLQSNETTKKCDIEITALFCRLLLFVNSVSVIFDADLSESVLLVIRIMYFEMDGL